MKGGHQEDADWSADEILATSKIDSQSDRDKESEIFNFAEHWIGKNDVTGLATYRSGSYLIYPLV